MIRRFLLVGAILLPHALQAQDRAAVSGIVTLASSGEAIENVVVTIRREFDIPNGNGEAVFGNPIQTTTDRTGRFSIANLVAAPYLLTLDRSGSLGFVNGQRSVRIFPQPSDAQPAANPLAFSVAFPKLGTIAGSVRDKSGQPVVGVAVFVLSAASGSPGAIGDGHTDARGDYRIKELPPGEFRVLAAPWVRLRAKPTDPPIRQNIPTFYPQAKLDSEAQVIGLREGEGVDGIDIVLLLETDQ